MSESNKYQSLPLKNTYDRRSNQGQSDHECLLVPHLATTYLVRLMTWEDHLSPRMDFKYKWRYNTKATSSSSDTLEKIDIFSLKRGQNNSLVVTIAT